MSYFGTVFTIIRKDVLEEFKSREVVNSMLVFALLVVIVFSFIFEPGSDTKNEVVGGILWMAITFAGVLGLNKSMMSEVSGGNLTALFLAPVDRSAVFFGKVLSNFIFLTVLEIIIVPLFMVLYNVNIFAHTWLPALILMIGTYGFAVLGTIFSLISVNTKTREIMLPLLLLPIMVPIILAGIQSINICIDGGDISGVDKWLKLIIIFDIIFTAVIFMIFDFLIED